MGRVLFIAADGLKQSGVPNLMMFEARLLSKLGHKIDLIYFKKTDDDMLCDFKKVCRNVYYFGYKKNDSLKKRIGRYFEQPIYKSRFKKIVKNNGGYDVIHSFAETRSYPFFAKAKKLGIKNLILDNNSQEYCGGNFFDHILMKKEKAFLRKNCIFKAATLDVLFKSYGSKIKYKLINNPYNYEKFYFEEKSVTPKNLVMCQVASFSANKNQLFTINLLNEIKKEIADARVAFLGFEHEKGYLNLMKSRIREFGLDESVDFYDSNHNVKELFDISSCLLLPSLKEANPLVLIEAQACGLKCYCSSNVSIETDKGNCSYIPLNDIQLWLRKIIHDWRNGLIKRSRCDLSQHSVEYQFKMYKELYSLFSEAL